MSEDKPKDFWVFNDVASRFKVYDEGVLHVSEILPNEISEIKTLRAENARLRKELIHYETDALHSCWNECTRSICVERRETEGIRVENEKLKKQLEIATKALSAIKDFEYRPPTPELCAVEALAKIEGMK